MISDLKKIKIYKENINKFLIRVFGKERFFVRKKEEEYLISVVIGARNRDEYLKHCLCSLLNQSLSKNSYEIIVVNYGGEEKTRKLINSFKSKNIKYIYTNERGVFNEARAKNIGIRNAKGEIICTTNADVLFPYNILSYIVNKHKNNKKLILQLQRKDIGRNLEWEHFLYPKNRLSKLNRFTDKKSIRPMEKCWAGECASVRRKELLNVKGFNEIIEGWGAADWEIFIRLEENGLKRVFIDKIGVFHQFHPNKIKAPLSEFQKNLGESGKEYRQRTISAWKKTKKWGVIKN